MSTTTNTGAASLLPCPMCGEQLEAWGVNFRHSPTSTCLIGYALVTPPDIAGWNRRATTTPQADAAPSLPRYTEWLHLRTHGQWSDGVPEWARDHDGRMNDVTAANAVIEELADAAIAAGGAQEPARVDTGPNLEGLREKMLAPRSIERTSDGWLYHPDYPTCDEGTRADKFLEAFGIETAFVGMESDAPDLAERWHEESLTDCSEWTPTPPGGDGWLLLEIYDTEDGPYALFGRDHYAAEQARKKEHTRRLSEAVRRARLERAAASNGEQAC